jgi:hypothetical protein
MSTSQQPHAIALAIHYSDEAHCYGLCYDFFCVDAPGTSPDDLPLRAMRLPVSMRSPRSTAGSRSGSLPVDCTSGCSALLERSGGSPFVALLSVMVEDSLLKD